MQGFLQQSGAVFDTLFTGPKHPIETYFLEGRIRTPFLIPLDQAALTSQNIDFTKGKRVGEKISEAKDGVKTEQRRCGGCGAPSSTMPR